MSEETVLPATEPGGRVTEPDGAPRIAILDILRGIAILGILFMNINDMGQSFSGPDIRHFGWTPADQFAWWTRAILADGTARCMLEMLFGAGMVILTGRIAEAAAGKWRVMRRYYWRNIMLWLFGLAHIFVFMWGGDILHTYGIAALIAFWFRRVPPRWLIVGGLSLATAQLCLAGYFAIYKPYHAQAQVAAVHARQAAGQPLTRDDQKILKDDAKHKAQRAEGEKKHDAEIAAEDKARSGTSLQWFREQWSKGAERLGIGELFAIWEASATMLIGAALFKLGILQGRRGRGFYVRLTLIAYAIGASLRTFGAWEETRFHKLPHISWATDEYARLAMTLGHVGAVNLIVATALGARLLRPFVAAGRTALTVYVLQTIACLWILFPPWGFRLYGHFGWMMMMLVSVAINAVLLWAANIYVRHYAIAPVEWAWRSIVEGRRLPIRMRAAVPAAI